MLSLVPASPDDYPFFYEIEPPVDCQYDDWLATVTMPQWANYLVHKAGQRVGGLFLECVSANTVEFHYSTVRHTVKPAESARLLVEVGRMLFTGGVECAQAVIPVTNRAANRLATACGMIRDGITIRQQQPFWRHLLTRQMFFDSPERWG